MRFFVTVMPVALLACGAERSERPMGTDVLWRGYVYEALPTGDDDALLVDGAVTFTPEGGESSAAEQANLPDYPGYWSVTLAAGAAVHIDLAGDALYTTHWAGDAPRADGSWTAGVLFGAERVWADAFFGEIAVALGREPAPLGTSTTWTWAFRRDGGGGDCASVRIAGVAPACFLQGEDGAWTPVAEGPWSHAVLLDTPPGEVSVVVGERTLETYQAAGGDVIIAGWLTEEGT